MFAEYRAKLFLIGCLGKPPRLTGGALPDRPACVGPGSTGAPPQTGRKTRPVALRRADPARRRAMRFPRPAVPVQQRRFRKLVTKRALWHSGRPIRRAGGPCDFRDLGILRARGARRAERRPRACHRARFMTNLRKRPSPDRLRRDPCQRRLTERLPAFRLCGETPRKNAYEGAFVSLESDVPRAIRCARRVSLPRKAHARR